MAVDAEVVVFWALLVSLRSSIRRRDRAFMAKSDSDVYVVGSSGRDRADVRRAFLEVAVVLLDSHDECR